MMKSIETILNNIAIFTGFSNFSVKMCADKQIQYAYAREQMEIQTNGNFVAVLQSFRVQIQMSYQMTLFPTRSLQFILGKIDNLSEMLAVETKMCLYFFENVL